jgi:hypothetical protein
MSDTPERFDAVAERVINKWIKGFSVEKPDEPNPMLRAKALRSIARIATEKAEQAEAEGA